MSNWAPGLVALSMLLLLVPTGASEVVPTTASIDPAIFMALEEGGWVEDGRLGVLVHFDHTPGIEDLELLGALRWETRFVFHQVPIVSGTIAITQLDSLAALEGVTEVGLNGRVKASLQGAIPEHGVDDVRNDYDYYGEGTVIAVLDTGIDDEHQGLDDLDDQGSTDDPKVIAFYDAVNTPGQDDGSVEAFDDHGHGSHCAGIAAGTGAPTGNHVGVAPQALLVGVKVLSGSGSGSFDQVMAGMQWVIDNKDTFDIDIATMSLGAAGVVSFTSSQADAIDQMANDMVAAGIITTIAAGNDGPSPGTIGTPGSAEDVITVGATDHDRNLASYSSRGPTSDGRVKPDVVAVGSDVMSVEANTANGYVAFSGTSMATPMVAGMAALLVQADPEIVPADAKQMLEDHAEARQGQPGDGDPNNNYGHGFVEALPTTEDAGDIGSGLDLTINAPATADIQETVSVQISGGPMDRLEKRIGIDSSWATISGTSGASGTIDVSLHDSVGNWTLLYRGVKGAEYTPIEYVAIELVDDTPPPPPAPVPPGQPTEGSPDMDETNQTNYTVSWSPAWDLDGIASYELHETSNNGTSWLPIASGLHGTTFDIVNQSHGHYAYRARAFNTTGVATAYSGTSDGIFVNLSSSSGGDSNETNGTTNRTDPADPTRAPTFANLTPEPGSVLDEDRPTISVRYTGTVAGIEVSSVLMSVDGEMVAAQITSSRVSFQPPGPLSTGVHTVEVELTDFLGNEGSTSWSFTIEVPDRAVTTGFQVATPLYAGIAGGLLIILVAFLLAVRRKGKTWEVFEDDL